MNVVRIYTTSDGTVGRSITHYDTMDAAKQAYHQYMANGISDPNITTTTVVLMDDYGAVYAVEKWVQSAEDTTEE